MIYAYIHTYLRTIHCVRMKSSTQQKVSQLVQNCKYLSEILNSTTVTIMYTRFQSRLEIVMELSNLWAIAREHWKFKVSNIGPYLKKWSSATAGVQNVLLVHGHTTVDVDATVLWPGRWYRGQGAATPQPDMPSGDRCQEYGNNLITDDRHQPLFENSFRNLFAP